MEVFYCAWFPRDKLREAIAKPCLMMWQTMCDPWMVLPPNEQMTGKEFQSWRRKFAEEFARDHKYPFYIIADDDCMPLGKNFLERCEDLMNRYPQYAILGTEDYCAPYDRGPYKPDEVFDTATGGGINVIRTGIIEVPPFNGQTWDGCAQGEQVRAKGWKVGRMRDVRRNHFGDGLSTVWPDDYKSGDTQIA